MPVNRPNSSCRFSVAYAMLWHPRMAHVAPSVQSTGMSCGRSGPMERQEFVLDEEVREGSRRLLLEPLEIVPADRVVFHLSGPGDFHGRLFIRAVREPDPDLEIVESAHASAQAGHFGEAIRKLRQYEAFSTENPTVCHWMAEWFKRREDYDRAGEYAARALRRGHPESCLDLYRSVEADRPAPPLEEIRELQAAAGEWQLEPHLGAVVLERAQHHSLGLNGGQLRRTQETLEIRRPAAARMLRDLRFAFSSRRELILHTSLQVIRPTGEVEELSPEHFTVTDDRRSDIFVTVEGEKAGHWILPDLAAGDVIRWRYDIFHRDEVIDGSAQEFLLEPLFHRSLPTLRATCRFVAPKGTPLRFAVRNTSESPSVETVGESRVHTFEGRCFVPAKGTGFKYENVYLNPVVGCAAEALDWPRVARQARRSNFGPVHFDEEVPEPLAGLIHAAPDAERGLEEAFYWTRDKLKYASVHSGEARIGGAHRAREIVEAGLGDCKDKSYLLALVCRALGIPYELVAISTKTGVLIEELTANQFDHVMLRARTKAGWAYLDAANPSSVFGLPPAWCQGMSVLTLTEEPEIVALPTHSPEANRMEFTEILDERHHDRLSGRFHLRAKGQSARFIDEIWKAFSLSFDSESHGGQQALREYLPSALLMDLSKQADTSRSDEFAVEGRHLRGPLVALDGSQKSICTLGWDVPFLPFNYWRTFQSDRLFAVNLPARLTIAVRLEGELKRALSDVSGVEGIDTAIGSVEETVSEEPGAVTVRRVIELRGHLFRDDRIAMVRSTFERIEEATQLVLVFGHDT